MECRPCMDTHRLSLTLRYLKAFFLATKLVSFATLDNLLSSQVFEEVVTSVSKSAEVGVGSGA